MDLDLRKLRYFVALAYEAKRNSAELRAIEEIVREQNLQLSLIHI